MKIKRLLSILLLSLTSIFAFSAVDDTVNTAFKVVKQIQISSYGPDDAVYFFVAEGSQWDTPNCGDGVTYAYIRKSQPLAAAALSAALTSKTTKVKLRFTGLCGDTGGNTHYLRITKVIVGE